jgi:Tfp pilus assembly protein FimT
LVVVGLIGTLAVVSLPRAMSFLRYFEVRGGAQQVASQVGTARAKAIGRNVSLGVVFMITSQTTYRWVVEDDQNPAGGFRATRDTLANLLADPQQAGPVQTLPRGIVFDTTGANDVGFRFNRLGAWCDPTGSAEPCPALTGTNYLVNSATGTTITVIRQAGGASPVRVLIGTGGRVRVQ